MEVVSPDDRLSDLIKRAEDYLDMGVPETWIFDPETKRSYIYSKAGVQEWIKQEPMRSGVVELDPARLFAEDE